VYRYQNKIGRRANPRAALGNYLYEIAGFAASLVLCGNALAQVGITGVPGETTPITVVYPTATPTAVLRLGPFEIDAALDAPPQRGNGRLVMISHGSRDWIMTNFLLASTLARAGFVVAIPEHRGDNWREIGDAGPVAWKRRPAEISRAIDAVSRDARFGPLVNTDRVGVYGMSAGGLTALLLAGADWNLAAVYRHCAAHAVEDAALCLSGRPSAEADAQLMREYSGPLPPGAEDLQAGPRARDPRIAAAAAGVPVGAILTPESLKAIRIPVGIVEAQADRMLNPAYHSAQVLKECGSCQRLDSIPGAAHLDLLAPWPEPIVKATAGMRGAERNAAVDDARRNETYARIADFFRKYLLD
jgi:predicted dienelactone hydrolase